MRIRFLHLLTIALILCACQPAAPAPVPEAAPTLDAPTPTLLDTPWSDRGVFAAGLVESQQTILAGLPGASVYHLDLTISSDLLTVAGAEEVLYTNTETEPLEQVGLHLFPNILGSEMSLSSVQLDGVGITPTYGDGDSSIRIPLASALEPGASTVIRIEFQVRVPQDLELNYGMLASSSGVLAYAHGYPMLAAYDSDGWNLDLPPLYADITYADASFYLVHVRAPADLVLCGSGIEISRQEADGQQEVTLAAGPARDFFLAASREYAVFTQQVGPTIIRTCARADMQVSAQRALDIAARSLELFGSRYAPYPYTELDIAAIPTLALGIEYPGAFALNLNLLTPEVDFESAPEDILLESTVAHETAHEWFYGLVGNDQLDDPWLDEAMAQYATLEYYETNYGESGAVGITDSFYGRWDRVERESIPIGLPVEAYGEVAYYSVVYGRGPLFFVELRESLGREAFDAFLREYTAAFSWEEATPEGLQQMAEAECECDLDDLFNDWVYGCP